MPRHEFDHEGTPHHGDVDPTPPLLTRRTLLGERPGGRAGDDRSGVAESVGPGKGDCGHHWGPRAGALPRDRGTGDLPALRAAGIGGRPGPRPAPAGVRHRPRRAGAARQPARAPARGRPARRPGSGGRRRPDRRRPHHPGAVLVVDVPVLRSGHSVTVFGTDRTFNHAVGRGVDIWALDGIPVIERERSPWRPAMELWRLTRILPGLSRSAAGPPAPGRRAPPRPPSRRPPGR